MNSYLDIATQPPLHTQVKSITGRQSVKLCSQSLPSFRHFCDSLLACGQSLGMQQLAKETRLVIFTTIFQTGSATTVEGLSFQPNLKPLQLVVTSSSTQCVLCTLPQQMKKQISLNIPPSCWLVSCVKLIIAAYTYTRILHSIVVPTYIRKSRHD